MRLVVLTIPVAILVGYLAGGRLGNLANVRFRWPVSGLASIALQFAPVAGTGGTLLLVGSFLFLFVAAGVNRRLPGFALILVFVIRGMRSPAPGPAEGVGAADPEAEDRRSGSIELSTAETS